MPRLKIDPSIFTIPANIAVTGRIKSWLKDLEDTVNLQDNSFLSKIYNKQFGYEVNNLRRLPASCTVYVVGDSMDEIENSIEQSWLFASQALRNGAGVAIHLSNLRPKNTPNGKGLVSSGPVSFAQIYSKLNEILRRGGTFRNGACTLHLDYDHPDIVEFATASRELLPWARRAINVDNNFINHPDLNILLKSIEVGDCFLVKKQYDKNSKRLYHNVCVSGDTWVSTTKGPAQVKHLINIPFSPIVNSIDSTSSNKGFWSTGIQPVFELITKEGYSIKATADHKFLKSDNSWVELQNLKKGDYLCLNNFNDINYNWLGHGDFISGEFVGKLLNQLNLNIDNLQLTEKLKFDLQDHLKNTLLDFNNFYKDLTHLIENSSSCFYKGFIQGYFNSNAKIDNIQKHIYISNFEKQTLKLIQRMLLRFGIKSYIKQKANSLFISDYKNIKTLSKFIKFTETKKCDQLDKLLSTKNKTIYNQSFTVKVNSIKSVGVEEVFDCSIDDIHCFDANGLIAHNCQEILIPHKGTCILSHVNLGAVKIDDIVDTFCHGMEWLCKIHSCTGVHLNGYYLNPKEDRQVGLGVLGLANLLAIENITYENLTRAMEKYLGWSDKPCSNKANILAHTLLKAFRQSSLIARSYNLDRAFTVAPTANCSFKYKDREFYVTTPEIAPPIDICVERDSQTMGVIEVDYHPDCEIASDVGWDVYYRLNKAWQGYMDTTGLAHAISTNWWSDKVIMNKELVTDWLNSPLKSFYYAWQVSPLVQDKSEILTSESFQNLKSTCLINNDEDAYNSECSSCAE